MLKVNHRQKRIPSSRALNRLLLSEEEESAAAVVVAFVCKWLEEWRGVKEISFEE
jgi:hypothetical protein